jgi:hypothetical protein
MQPCATIRNYKTTVLEPFLTRSLDSLLSYRWWTAIWVINGFFIALTVIYFYLRPLGVPQFFALFTLEFERNLATYWSGWCLLIVAILAMERFFYSAEKARYERQAWLGLAVLAASLSFDELGSMHERASFLFAPWGLSGRHAFLPLALPAFLIVIFTLERMSRFRELRCFWLTLGACVLLGSVVLQEHLEYSIQWPFWARGIRFGVEEGTELAGIFLLLTVVLAPTLRSEKFVSVAHIFPSSGTLIRLKSTVVLLTLLSFIPLGMVTVVTLPIAAHKGSPAVWLPFVLLNLSCMVAWSCAQLGEAYRNRFLLVSLVALFFSLDQIIVFQRVIDTGLRLGVVEECMFIGLTVACMSIPMLRTQVNLFLVMLLLPLTLHSVFPSELFPRLVIPLQSLGIFSILVSGLVAMRRRPVCSR